MKDGRLNICIECTVKRVKKHRYKNIEKIREYDRMRASRPDRYAKLLAYSRSEKGLSIGRKVKKEYRLKNKHKVRAHQKLRLAVKSGKLKKKACERCSDKKTVAHHDDYNKPLSVIWLCHKHHMELHRLNGDFRKT